MADPLGSLEKIVKLALRIKEAVDTVRHNKEECQQITTRAVRVSTLLSRLPETGITGDPAMCDALGDLEDALRHAHALVTACQQSTTVCLYCTAGKQARRLRRVQDDISQKVMLVVFATNIHTTIILTSNICTRDPLPPAQVVGAMAAQPVVVPSNSSADDASSFEDCPERSMRRTAGVDNLPNVNVSFEEEVEADNVPMGSGSRSAPRIAGSPGSLLEQVEPIHGALRKTSVASLHLTPSRSRAPARPREPIRRHAYRESGVAAPGARRQGAPPGPRISTARGRTGGPLATHPNTHLSPPGLELFPGSVPLPPPSQPVPLQHVQAPPVGTSSSSPALSTVIKNEVARQGIKLAAQIVTHSLFSPDSSTEVQADDGVTAIADCPANEHGAKLPEPWNDMSSPTFKEKTLQSKSTEMQADDGGTASFLDIADCHVNEHGAEPPEPCNDMSIPTFKENLLQSKSTEMQADDGATASFLDIADCCANEHGGELPEPLNDMSIPTFEEKILQSKSLREFSFSELEAATHQFSVQNMVGSGSFATVYKGVLQDGCLVAVKKFQHPNVLSAGKINKLHLLSELNHSNIVKLIGYSGEVLERAKWFEDGKAGAKEDKGTSYLLVEEYIPNGSLDKTINNGMGLDWSSRFHLIQGIAHGLCYLHKRDVIHLDVKPSNILLDSDMNPKITDFGIAKVLNHSSVDFCSDIGTIEGTLGYMPPEYITDGTLSKKHDVYGFGVTLLDIVSGMLRSERPTGQASIEWAWQARQVGGGVMQLLNPSLFDAPQLKEIERCVEVGLLCTQFDPADRPDMLEALEILRGEKALRTPVRPGYTKEPVASWLCRWGCLRVRL